MAYYIVYDINDNICFYAENNKELSNITGIRSKDINYLFKNKEYIKTIINHNFYKIYRFFER